MIVVMKNGAGAEQVQAVADTVTEWGLKPHVSQGEERTVTINTAAAGGNVEAVVPDVVGAQLAVAPMIEAAQRMGQVDEAGFRIGMDCRLRRQIGRHLDHATALIDSDTRICIDGLDGTGDAAGTAAAAHVGDMKAHETFLGSYHG